MNIWMNKMSGDLCLVHPQYEPVPGMIKFDEKFYHDLMPDMRAMIGKRKVVHGALVQVGWLLQNSHDVWIGVPMNVSTLFEDIGEA
jgi:hypothetical protein